METTPAPPSKEIKTLKRDHINRLLIMADRMVADAEKLKRPTEPADLEKHAKALLTVTKTVAEIHELATRTEASCGDVDMNDPDYDTDNGPDTGPDGGGTTLADWRGFFERKLDRLADVEGAAGVAEQPDDPAVQTPP
ncbi:hypothetical protein Q1W73_01720 [Asticcacaulis sp. ZE23SCel15]|uniref:hypothetical protein n=1 Tax=Asticcacaulis sp. ZE23SCel15 TaxID=3059027 RepID=UPI00265FE765|nr:hypothetical protein [Asticcacaulis sp. ZE23SCel15]WKL57725.1 hypothetical protein Q1W73_01720 [Asticcacaulis sp. ZE23SCel15]